MAGWVARPYLTPAPGNRFRPRIGLGLFLGFGTCFLVDERLTVGHRDLVIIGMDFVERQKAVPIATIVDERRLQRRFDPRDLGEIDIAAQQFPGSALVIELLYPASTQNHDPGLFRMGGINEHFVV